MFSTRKNRSCTKRCWMYGVGEYVALAAQMAGVLALALSASAQTVVPVDRSFRPPMQLNFSGDWKCSDGGATGLLKVAGTHRKKKLLAYALGSAWTEIVESQDGLNGEYFVGYDRDHQQFLIIDAEDPAYAAYQTDGWKDRKLTLTQLSRTGEAPTDRFVYEVSSADEFVVTWEWLQATRWEVKNHYTCRKIASQKP